MTTTFRFCLALAISVAFLAELSADPPTSLVPAKKPVAPSLKEVEANPASFLGSRLTLPAWLAPASRTLGTGAELSVFIDAKTPAGRLRFLAPKSLAESVAAFKESRRVRLTGTVLAAESVRSGHTFEVEEIDVLDDGDRVVETLKPTAGPLPTIESKETVAEAPPVAKEPGKPVEAAKKGGEVSTLLIVGAALMAALLLVLSVVGVRLMKYMKAKPPENRKRATEKAAVEE